MFAHPVYLQAIRVWLLYEGHPVEVKVAGAKKVETSYSLSVRLPLAVTPKHRGVQWVFRLWQIEWCDRHLCRVTGSEDA